MSNAESINKATLGSRIVAFLYDYILISAYLIILSLVTVALMQFTDDGAWSAFFQNPFRADLVAFLTTVLPVSLYFAFSESSPRRASWGKRKRGLKVETVDGAGLSRGQALLRSALKFLPWQIAHTCLFNIPGWPINPQTPPIWVMLGLILVWVLVAAHIASVMLSKENQSWYDRLLGVRVALV